MTIKFTTYNTEDTPSFGKGYYQMHTDSKKSLQEFNALGKAVGKDLEKQDIVCLQESCAALEAGWFSNETFEWIGRASGQAILWNKERFSLVVGSITNEYEILALDLFDHHTHKIVRVASVHFTGYDIAKAQKNDKDEIYSINENIGNFTRKIGAARNRSEDFDLMLIGSDTNSIPSRFGGVHQMFTDLGFKYQIPSQPTNYHLRSKENRTLDYVFYQSPSETIKAKENPNPKSTHYQLSHVDNPSDHIPVNYTITFSSLAMKVADFVTRPIGFFIPETNRLDKPKLTLDKISTNLEKQVNFTSWGEKRRELLDNHANMIAALSLFFFVSLSLFGAVKLYRR